MKKALLLSSAIIFLIISISYSRSAQLKAAATTPQDTTPIDPVFPGLGVITSRHMEDGRLSTSNQAIFGPNICVDYGDPFSPWNSPYEPGSYTYQYRLRIPADYPSDIVRVELFDPDSINQAVNNFNISRSDTAINNGLSPTDSKSCGFDGGSSSQTNPCLLRTDELNLVTAAPNLDLDQVNPYWFVRIDEHRGTGGPPGNGTCGNPATYTPGYNTSTLFELTYYPKIENETERVTLVSYTGQTGDNVRDAGDHNTDMRWVSPGADVPFSNVDSPGNLVPATPYAINSFEVDLTTDVPNIQTDPQTGDRYLYLEVTTLSGASENGYEVWAGPPNYVDSVPSEVNARNVYILNNPGSHDSQGLEITAVNTLLQNSNISIPVDIPLAYIGPEASGQTISISLYDTDSGAQPPWIFYFDTLAFTPDDSNPLGYDPSRTDWAMAFGVTGQPDPDGVAEGVRCLPGACQSQWVVPPYQITIPGDLSNCDWQNPTTQDCTPFYGGRLMVRLIGGVSDTYAWQLPKLLGELTVEQTAGCTAFPIAIGEAVRSVTAPGTGSNPYPNPADFTYPTNPPAYESFISHQEDIPLLNASPGDIFRVQNGFGDVNFGWLVWNQGIAADTDTLANSLTWPGDSPDYSDHGDAGNLAAITGWGGNYVPRGYIEPGNPTDQALQIGDWLAASTEVVNSASTEEQLNSHIDLERTLRLPIWDTTTGSGSDTRLQTSQFAIFRLIGYNLTSGWLLLEFVGLETSCGQLPVAPTSVDAIGPTEGEADSSYTFTATISPTTTTTPITYTWEITDFDPIVNVGGLSDSITVEWVRSGSKEVLVTAVNSTGLSVSQSQTITVANQELFVPFVNKN